MNVAFGIYTFNWMHEELEQGEYLSLIHERQREEWPSGTKSVQQSFKCKKSTLGLISTRDSASCGLL